MILELLGAAVSFCGGFYLFSSDEDKRRRQRDIVKVEAEEERRCARCLRPATLGRWAGTRWIYGAEEACLYERCAPMLRASANMELPLSAALDEALGLRIIREWATPRLVPPRPICRMSCRVTFEGRCVWCREVVAA